MKALKKLWDSNIMIAWFYDFKQEILISFFVQNISLFYV